MYLFMNSREIKVDGRITSKVSSSYGELFGLFGITITLHVTSYAFGYMPIYTSYTYIQLPSLIEGAYICDTPLDYIVSVYSHIYCIHVLHMCRESMAGSTS